MVLEVRDKICRASLILVGICSIHVSYKVKIGGYEFRNLRGIVQLSAQKLRFLFDIFVYDYIVKLLEEKNYL